MLNKKNIIIISIFTLITFIVLIILTIFIGFYFLKQKPKQKNQPQTAPQTAPQRSEQELRIGIQRQELKQFRDKNKVDNNSEDQIGNQRKALKKLINQ